MARWGGESFHPTSHPVLMKQALGIVYLPVKPKILFCLLPNDWKLSAGFEERN